ncbi:MAG TPA: nitroreductase family protein [Solirubrobacterales bacterium]|jgi:nitroreductase
MPDTPAQDGAAEIDVANADLLLSTTRAVRRRLDFDRPVEPEVLLECLQLAVQAPTASNRQTWRWVVVTDPDLKSRLADLYRQEGMPYLQGSRVAAEGAGDASQIRVYESALHLAENLERAPVFVIPCIAEDLAKRDQHGVIATLGSIIQAGWSFQLALRARGLGSTWTTLHLGQAQAAADLLRIPDGVTQVSLIPVAYTKGLRFRPAKRPPVTEITYWNRWEASGPADAEARATAR